MTDLVTLGFREAPAGTPIVEAADAIATGGPTPAIVSMLDDFQDYRMSGNWSAMLRLLHPQARLESLAAPGAVLSPPELVAAIESAMTRGLYTVRNWAVELLDPHTALAGGRVRYRIGTTGITDEGRVWVSSERDGLIWRMRILATREEVLVHYRETGIDLGL
jgi:hypothetical protein